MSYPNTTPQQKKAIIRALALNEYYTSDYDAIIECLLSDEDNYFTPGIAWTEKEVGSFVEKHQAEINRVYGSIDDWLRGGDM